MILYITNVNLKEKKDILIRISLKEYKDFMQQVIKSDRCKFVFKPAD